MLTYKQAFHWLHERLWTGSGYRVGLSTIQEVAHCLVEQRDPPARLDVLELVHLALSWEPEVGSGQK